MNKKEQHICNKWGDNLQTKFAKLRCRDNRSTESISTLWGEIEKTNEIFSLRKEQVRTLYCSGWGSGSGYRIAIRQDQHRSAGLKSPSGLTKRLIQKVLFFLFSARLVKKHFFLNQVLSLWKKNLGRDEQKL